MAGYEEPVAVRKAVPKLDSFLDGNKYLQKDNDLVNSPSHYTDGGIETIDFIEAKKLNYNLGNAVKYITRMGKKFNRHDEVPKQMVQDLEKAVWYLQREIKKLKG